MIVSNPAEEKVVALLAPALEELGFRFVRVRLSGLKRKRLQLMVERTADGGMGLEDCERVSRAISPILDAHDPISGEYDLEVSSPGIDRPLVRAEDFVRFVGHEAKLELTIGIDGRRKFRGDIAPAADGKIALAMPDGTRVEAPFSQVGEARLILTDRLIAEDLKRARASGDLPDEDMDPGEADNDNED